MVSKDEMREANRIVKALAEFYQVTVAKDWGEEKTPEGVFYRKGKWSLKELRALRQGIDDLARALGGADEFVNNLGSVTITQVEMSSRGRASKGSAKFTASDISFDTWTIVHELAHVWDANLKWRLSRALERYTGGRSLRLAVRFKMWLKQCDTDRRLPGCNRFGYFYGGIPPAGSDRNFNRREDFAESVVAYVYPDSAQGKVEKYRGHKTYGELLYYKDYAETKRWEFVDGLIKGTILIK
jgi:hypothetical protein